MNSRRKLPRWMRDGSGAVDSGAMTNNHIAARLGYLEQALFQLALYPSTLVPQRMMEQYVARYFDDFGPVSLQIFDEYLNRKSL